MAMSNPERLAVSVFYAPAPVAGAQPGAPAVAPRVFVVKLELAPGATVGDAVAASGLLVHFPGIAIEGLDLGVFNRACGPERRLLPGDRVEIYRPLQIEPKEARHLRVAARRKADARARQAPRGGAGREGEPGGKAD